MKVSSVEAQSGTQNSQEPKPEVKGSTGGSGSVAAIHEGYDHDKVIFTVDDGEKIGASFVWSMPELARTWPRVVTSEPRWTEAKRSRFSVSNERR